MMVGPHFSSGRAMLATLDYINRLFLSQGNTINYRTDQGLTLGDVIAALREAVPKLRISFSCLCNLETRFW